MSLPVEQHKLSFEVRDVKSQGRVPGKQRERYWVKVAFDNGKTVAFHCTSPSLDVAFEMIEAFGRQTEKMKPDAFDGYMNTIYGKRLFFALSETKTGGQAVGYQHNRYGNALEHAFANQPFLEINLASIEYLKEQAALEQAKLDAARHAKRHFRVVLQARPG